MSSGSNAQSTASTAPATRGDDDDNRTLVIALTAVFSVLGLLLLAGAVFLWHRYRQKRVPFFQRGITPIDDEEIESWKVSPEVRHEKHESSATGTALVSSGPRASESNARPPRPSTSGGKDETCIGSDASPTTPTKKIPSAVIVYQNQPSPGHPTTPGYRHSEELSPRSMASSNFGGSRSGGRASMDKDLPQTPLQARAPNAREGLTDESIPGDEPYVPLPRRQSSRITKLPSQIASPRLAHTRTRSSRSSMRSFGLGWDHHHHSQPQLHQQYQSQGQSQQHQQLMQGLTSPYGYSYCGGLSSLEHEAARAAGRASSDYPRSSAGMSGYSPPRTNYSHHRHHESGVSSHSRVYSTSTIPPRLSFSDDLFGSPRPLLREDIGRAIG